jgi:D-xylose transport system substrate-binding protein
MSRTTATLGAVAKGLALACGATLVLTACGNSDSGTTAGTSGASGSATKLVYFMQPDTTPTRYLQQDGPDFKKAMAQLDPNVTVKFANAGGSAATQLSQVNAAIAAGAKAIVMVAADPNTSGSILQAAQTAKVPVIGYENPPLNGQMYAQVMFNPSEAGVLQAKYFASQVESGALGAKPVTVARLYGNKGDVYTTQMLDGQNSVLKPLIDNGAIKVVCEDYVANWDPANAQKSAQQCLTKMQNKIGAFLGFYDGDTAGAIAAQKAAGVSIPTYGGQNPELSGLQYMLTGQQQDNVLKPFSVEATAAAKLAVAAIKGEQPPADLIKTTSDVGGGFKVPTALLDETFIHLEKGQDPGVAVQKAVDYGMFTWAQICTGPAKGTPTCKQKVG